MPVVWGHVEGVVPIFQLVEGCSISNYQDHNDMEVTSINLPDILPEDSFTRLRVYSSFVKSLEIFGSRPGIHYAMTNAPVLLSYTDHHELLPNLSKLTMDIQYSWMIAYFFWFRVFASHSLREIRPLVRRYDGIPFVPISVASSLVMSVVQRCPPVDTLGLFVRDDLLGESDHDLEHLAFVDNSEPLAQVLVQAKTLVNVVGSALLFDPTIFAALGQLPLLARLEVRYGERDEEEMPITLPTHIEAGAFLSLKCVVLFNVTDADIGFFWRQPLLVKNLMTIQITFHNDLASPHHRWIQQELVPLISRNSPKINELAFDFEVDTMLEDENAPFMFRISEETFGTIMGLSLTKLDLSRTRLNLPEGIARLATAWPKMEVLRWTAQHVTLDDLCLFAQHMPHLRELALEIRMAPLPEEFDFDRIASVRRPALQTLESGFHRICELTPQQGSRICQYLRQVWPNMRFTTRADLWRDDTPARKMDLKVLDLLNNPSVSVSRGGAPPDSGEPLSTEEAVQIIWGMNETHPGAWQSLVRRLPPEAT
ncbi:hypothetical protein FRC09_004042 [Ceratobasidium sp. 395]|nr:hypothetical protein FRC09_004042 [Ceratobasidium sp. 395]